ncbi:hypothetical protein B188_26550 [Candidatus Brocadiaceae bacterium B188]|nr:hypothetical protein B188_26550 [Candidatus Brocadiaceae bacterium B188]
MLVAFFYNDLYTASLIGYEYVIPVEAGIHKNTGSRVNPGMAGRCKRISQCIDFEKPSA